jgi:hypothetical protein
MSLTLPLTAPSTAADRAATGARLRPRHAAAPAAPASPEAVRPRVPDNREPYLAWGAAWLVGYGALALAGGDDPVLALPGPLPGLLLVAGLATATVVTALATVRDQRGVTGAAKTAGTLFGAAWATGFTALFLLITALARVLDEQLVHTLLWPTGSAVVVGLLYLMGGALHRDHVQYALGTYLALLGAAAVFLDSPGHYFALAVAGTPAYLAAAALEGRRRTAALRAALAARYR